jgi:hypothetical protein
LKSIESKLKSIESKLKSIESKLNQSFFDFTLFRHEIMRISTLKRLSELFGGGGGSPYTNQDPTLKEKQ